MVSELTGLEGGLEIGQKINEIIRAKADVNADTTGNAGTATKLQTARTISLTGDITGSTTFDGSANKSITTTLGNTTKIDGQWVSSTRTLSTATAVGTYTIDLSDYLPNDNYNYEVIIHFFGFRNSGDTNTQIAVSNQYYSTEIGDTFDLLNTLYATAHFDGNHAESGSFSTNMIITSNKNFYFYVRKSALKACMLNALAYRRIGSNT